MGSFDFSTVLIVLLPALIVGVLAFYFFDHYVKDQQNYRRFMLRREARKETLSYRLQALERMTLFLERIKPGNLLVRVKPSGQDRFAYEKKLVATIEKEFEHNLTQQLYVSSACWDAVLATKNATISLIRKKNISDKVDSAHKLREVILSDLVDKESPSDTGLAYLRKEAQEMW